ncbi:beta-lactamase family protein [Oleiagrimonas sp. C23AA]|nr:serine hydrolase domain-containing protein [Oleiagrimonas sp. C23AA]NII09537.1 beta-lactamase family protein [Oleiagrimonas sp. C23AA]
MAAPVTTAASASTQQTVGQKREGLLFWTQAQRHARFSHMYTLFPSLPVATGEHVHRLPKGKPLTPQWRDGTTLDSYMKRFDVQGVMVLQRGRVRLVRYAKGFGPASHWTSFSVAKSFTSTLLGVAMQRGDIHSLSDPLQRYIPELKGSAYGKVSVRQLLTMTSGVRWNEDYSDPKSDVSQMYRSACQGHEAHVLPYLEKLPRAYPAGTHWNYNTAETDLLGVLVQRATHQSLATLLTDAIWKPYGMATQAHWLTDECSGRNTGGSGLSATLSDYARMGQFILGGAKIDGKRVVAKAWLDGAFSKHEGVGEPGRGYGYQWWTYDDGGYAAIGIFGQLIYIDPSRQLVIVQLANWPSAVGEKAIAARHDFIQAVRRAAGKS